MPLGSSSLDLVIMPNPLINGVGEQLAFSGKTSALSCAISTCWWLTSFVLLISLSLPTFWIQTPCYRLNCQCYSNSPNV
ncbi:hypothetical protein M404DRAFT_443692 [Pisolithus tinctorius Marx 270]|uniref:Uncharacterized protein n=1 Tax=Pisolithus tinctorius Marx 270 TaxID=870435 RepID=A0A0C3J7R9_PISTI|nr:hypothetical protein M404DRAFT_443692 [Pisolithus tinctorius Marx 270]